eukprot:TRINITY_DN45253_c0_g1_i1.p1 TRINITY_DN45253_c0_g1~~TRINITY_DN45253_c0_g1_i1.p1  ORF type:complete len:118 (-),score=13.20 TRINITY_DN45253_c0_g1_i1:312-665(-)
MCIRDRYSFNSPPIFKGPQGELLGQVGLRPFIFSVDSDPADYLGTHFGYRDLLVSPGIRLSGQRAQTSSIESHTEFGRLIRELVNKRPTPQLFLLEPGQPKEISWLGFVTKYIRSRL